MPRTLNTHGGGALTNANGLHFEQTTDLDDALIRKGYSISKIGEVYGNGIHIGFSKRKKDFRRFLQANGVNLSVNSDALEPDDAFINVRNQTVYIIEKKFQSVSGSVDEKLQTCLYKKMQYEKLVSQIGCDIVYTYVLSDWFKQDKYRDVLNYIQYVGCYYFFNELPLDFLGL